MSIEDNFREDYFVKIEALFAALRDRGLLLSPDDYGIAKGWFDSGIPLSCVLRGIRDAVFHNLAKDDSEEVRRLGYCRWAVNREWNEYKAGNQFHQPDLAAKELSNDQVSALFQSFIFDLNRARQTALKSEVNDLASWLEIVIFKIEAYESLLHTLPITQDQLEAELRADDDEMMNSVIDNAPPELLDRIEADVIRKMRDSRNKMSATEFENTKEKAIKSRLRTALMLPVLTLYSL